MTDDLRTRIAAAIYEALREQHDGDSIDAPMVTPEIGGDRFTGYATIDGEVNLMAAADAVIRELNLDISHTYRTSQGREVCIEGFWTEEVTDD